MKQMVRYVRKFLVPRALSLLEALGCLDFIKQKIYEYRYKEIFEILQSDDSQKISLWFISNPNRWYYEKMMKDTFVFTDGELIYHYPIMLRLIKKGHILLIQSILWRGEPIFCEGNIKALEKEDVLNISNIAEAAIIHQDYKIFRMLVNRKSTLAILNDKKMLSLLLDKYIEGYQFFNWNLYKDGVSTEMLNEVLKLNVITKEDENLVLEKTKFSAVLHQRVEDFINRSNQPKVLTREEEGN